MTYSTRSPPRISHTTSLTCAPKVKPNMQGMLWHVLPVHLAFPSVMQATDHAVCVLCKGLDIIPFYVKAVNLWHITELVGFRRSVMRLCSMWTPIPGLSCVWPLTRPRPLGTFTRWWVCCSASSPHVTWSWHAGLYIAGTLKPCMALPNTKRWHLTSWAKENLPKIHFN